jgi:hypothetical protein
VAGDAQLRVEAKFQTDQQAVHIIEKRLGLAAS